MSDPLNQPRAARVLVQTLSTSLASARVDELRCLWTEGLASGGPQSVDGDWFASVRKRGMERLAKARGHL